MNKKRLLAIDLILAFVFLSGMLLFYEMKPDFLTSCFVLFVMGSAAIARVAVFFLMKRNR